MDNKEQDQPKNTKLIALIAVAVGAVILVGLFFISKNFRTSESQSGSQELFQGPAELSTTVQAECQQSAEKISKMNICALQEEEYFKHVANCQNVYYAAGDSAATSAEGNFGDLAIDIAKCYFDKDNAPEKTKAVLTKTLELPDWEIYMGPISCGSKSTLEAYLESFTSNTTFRCIKLAELPALVEELKSKKFSVLKELLPIGKVAQQGYIETDVSCPETVASIQKTLEKVLSDGFQITEPRIESTSHADVFIEFARQDARLLNLQFRPSSEGCLQFESLLAPSQESGE